MKKSKLLIFLMSLLILTSLFYTVKSFSIEQGSQTTKQIQVENKTENSHNKTNQNAKEATTAQPQSNSDNSQSLLGLFKLGGPFMWPLLFFSVFVLAVILERSFIFSKRSFKIKAFAKLFSEKLTHFGIEEAMEFCRKNSKNIASLIFLHSLPSLKSGVSEFEKSLETFSNMSINRLEKNLNLLSSMGNIAPLTGFLGTVSGMITAFKTIALSDNVTARLVAGGIYEALITTAFGLIIAILAVAFNNFFVHKVDLCIKEIEESSVLIIQNYQRENSL